MPNNVTNVLKVHGDEEKVKAMFEAVKTDELGIGSMDFNKIIPTPDNIFQGNLGTAEREKYGKNNWMDWNTSNWGSKWNSYGYSETVAEEFDGSCIEFFTAWCGVPKIMETLAGQYPDLCFEYKWADEDLGSNVGHIEYEDGEETFSSIPNGQSKEAYELASEVHGIDLADEGYLLNEDTNEYEYHPDEPLSMKME